VDYRLVASLLFSGGGSEELSIETIIERAVGQPGFQARFQLGTIVGRFCHWGERKGGLVKGTRNMDCNKNAAAREKLLWREQRHSGKRRRFYWSRVTGYKGTPKHLRAKKTKWRRI